MEKKYFVHEVSKVTGISSHTIRFYDKQGLFPDVFRDKNNKRVFTEQSMNWLSMIVAWRKTGLDIKNLKRYISLYLEGDSTLEERYSIILQQEKKLQRIIQELTKQLQMTRNKKDMYEEKILDGKEFPNPARWGSCLDDLEQ